MNTPTREELRGLLLELLLCGECFTDGEWQAACERWAPTGGHGCGYFHQVTFKARPPLLAVHHVGMGSVVTQAGRDYVKQ